MARIARVVVSGLPHHVVQRGNRRQNTFFREEDYSAYLESMVQWCLKALVEIWAYCLMPNHVHLIAVPNTETGLRASIGEAHKRYTRMVNDREGWKGHLWQGRFFSYPLDEVYLLAAVRHIETNPVRAGLAESPDQYNWSSARAHLIGRDDELVKVRPLLDRVANWRDFLAVSVLKREIELLRQHEKTGRPLGDEDFIHWVEDKTHRNLRRQKPGPKVIQAIGNLSSFVDGDETGYRPTHVR